MVVSMMAVGPVGVTGGLALLVVEGASGRDCDEGVCVAGVWLGGDGGGFDWAEFDWARAVALRVTARASGRSIMRFEITPSIRLSQTGSGSNFRHKGTARARVRSTERLSMLLADAADLLRRLAQLSCGEAAVEC